MNIPRNAPMGSTQNVGSSVNGGREPAEYDSSPMLQLRDKIVAG